MGSNGEQWGAMGSNEEQWGAMGREILLLCVLEKIKTLTVFLLLLSIHAYVLPLCTTCGAAFVVSLFLYSLLRRLWHKPGGKGTIKHVVDICGKKIHKQKPKGRFDGCAIHGH